MENIKPEEIIKKHITLSQLEELGYEKNIDWDDEGFKKILKRMETSHREYAQIACSTLSEESRIKDERIEELEESLKEINNLYQQWKKDEINDGVFSVLIYNQLLLTPPTNP